MSDSTDSTEAPVTPPATPEAPKAPTPTPPAPTPRDSDDKAPAKDSDVLLSKIRDLEKDLHSERVVKKELRARTEQYELADKKRLSLNAALGAIGEDFEIPSAKLAELHELVGDLQNSESLDAKIAKFVGLVKQAKGGKRVVTTPGLQKDQAPPEVDQNDDSAMLELAKTDPAAFRIAVNNSMYKHR